MSKAESSVARHRTSNGFGTSTRNKPDSTDLGKESKEYSEMPTQGEKEFMSVVKSSLREIARQLRIKNRLEEFRLRKEYSSAENDPILNDIMEDK